jgi:hypothetical protein
VREVPVADVLGVLDGDQLADVPLAHQPLQRREEGGVTEDVGNGDGGAGAGGRLPDAPDPLGRRGDRLLQEDVVPLVEGPHRRVHMHPVRGRDHHCVAESRLIEQRLPGVVAVLGGHAVGIGHAVQARRARVRDGHDPRLVRMVEAVLAVYLGAAVAGADQRQSYRFTHDAFDKSPDSSSLLLFSHCDVRTVRLARSSSCFSIQTISHWHHPYPPGVVQ